MTWMQKGDFYLRFVKTYDLNSQGYAIPLSFPKFSHIISEPFKIAFTTLFQILFLISSHASHFGDLLESPSVDLRIAAGEALVVLFEMAVDLDEDEAYKHMEDLTDSIKHLATDSQKHRSKKVRE